VIKVTIGHSSAPRIGSFGPAGELMAINKFGEYSTDIIIPLMVDVGVTGSYTITAGVMSTLGLTCLSLEDLSTGTITPLTDGATYTFSMNATADPSVPRFQLRATAPVTFSMADATCAGTPNGQASVELGGVVSDVTWTDAFGNVLVQQVGASGTATFDGLAAGSYMVQLGGVGSCSSLVREFTISAPFELEASVSTTAASCPDTPDGVLEVLVLGGTAPYTFVWSNGETTEDLTATPGTYSVTVTDANGCDWSSPALVIGSGPAPEAAIAPIAGVVLVGAEQLFEATAVNGGTYTWDLGDGTVAEGQQVAHTYGLPGVYLVTLTVSNGSCTSITTVEVEVELSTGVSGGDAVDLRAWCMNNFLVVEHGFPVGSRLHVDVLDATGQLVIQRSTAEGPGRILLPASGLASGVYFIRVSHGETRHTLRVPVVH
jgi:PKD repeat protein